MESREFVLSRHTTVTVYKNDYTLKCGVSVSKNRSNGQWSHLKLTLKEYKTFACVVPSLSEAAMEMHKEIVAGKTPMLRETRHVLSSRYMTMLSIYRSRTEGTFVIASLCPYITQEGVDQAVFPRGVTFSFDELIALAEQRDTIASYISKAISSHHYRRIQKYWS